MSSCRASFMPIRQVCLDLTSCTCERSFSKSKLIKIYLQSTISQERLNGLMMLSIENDITKIIDFEMILSGRGLH